MSRLLLPLYFIYGILILFWDYVKRKLHKYK